MATPGFKFSVPEIYRGQIELANWELVMNRFSNGWPHLRTCIAAESAAVSGLLNIAVTLVTITPLFSKVACTNQVSTGYMTWIAGATTTGLIVYEADNMSACDAFNMYGIDSLKFSFF